MEESSSGPAMQAAAPEAPAPSTARRILAKGVQAFFLILFGAAAFYGIGYLKLILMENMDQNMFVALMFGAILAGVIVGGIVGAKIKQALLK